MPEIPRFDKPRIPPTVLYSLTTPVPIGEIKVVDVGDEQCVASFTHEILTHNTAWRAFGENPSTATLALLRRLQESFPTYQFHIQGKFQ